MPIHDWLVRAVTYPAWQRRRRGRVLSTLARLERTQWWSTADMTAYQLARLRRLVAHAREHSPYYRGVFAQAGVRPQDLRDLADLGALPVLGKEALRSHAADLLTVSTAGLVKRRTSGSTGIPVVVWAAPEARDAWVAASLRLQGWWGVRVGDRRLTLISRHDLRPATWLKQFAFANTLEFSAMDLSEEVLDRVCHRLRHGRVRALLGYPTSLTHLAGYAAARRVAPSALRAVFTTGETLYPDQRALLHRVFRCPVVDEYGSSEMGHLAGECPAGCLHVAAENVLLEFVPAASPDPLGTREILVTDLTNFAMPLIRYRLGDLGEPAEPCPCGRGLPALRLVEGRTAELVVLPDGRRLDFTIFAGVFETLAEAGMPLYQYRVEQHAPDAFEVHVVGGDLAAHEEAIRAGLVAALRVPVRVRIRPVAQIPADPTGKRRRFISHLTAGGSSLGPLGPA